MIESSCCCRSFLDNRSMATHLLAHAFNEKHPAARVAACSYNSLFLINN